MTREELNESVLKNKKNILEQKMVLEKLLNDEKGNLENTNISIDHYNSNIKAYKDYKKRTLKRLATNIAQITGIFALMAMSSHFIFDAEVINTFSIGMGICALYGNVLLIAERKYDLNDYKNDLFEGLDIEELNDSKNYLEEHIKTLENDIVKVNDSLSKFKVEEKHEEKTKVNQENKDYKFLRKNVYTNFKEDMKNKVKKLHK